MPRIFQCLRTRHIAAAVLFAIGLIVAWYTIPLRPRAVFDPGPPTWPGGRRAIASADGTKVAIAGIPAVQVWDVARSRLIASLPGSWLPGTPPHRRQTWPWTFSHDGTQLVTSYFESGEWHLLVWDLGTGRGRLVTSSGRFMDGIQFSPDDRTLYVQSFEFFPFANWKWVISAWNLEACERRIVATINYPNEFHGFALSPDGQTLACGTMPTGPEKPGHIVLWDVAAGRERASIPVQGWSERLTFSPDGATLVAENLGTITVWDVTTCTEQYSFRAFSDWCDAGRIWVDPGGEILAIQLRSAWEYHSHTRSLPRWLKDWLYWDTVALWDLKTGRRLATLPDDLFLTFADGGRTLLTYGGDHTLRWWDVPPEKPYLRILLAALLCGLFPALWSWSRLALRAIRSKTRHEPQSPTVPVS